MKDYFLPSSINISRAGPLLLPLRFSDYKDPCPVFDGKTWHIYGSGGASNVEIWEILHATAPSLHGPWTEQESVVMYNKSGPHSAAPGVVFDHKEAQFHMFVQTECFGLGGKIEHRVSDNGTDFILKDIALDSIPGTNEAGIYDPHPAIIRGEKYLVYSGMPTVARGDVCLAKSATNTWDGPWSRLGKILTHAEVPHHNQLDDPRYEWGLEGPQLIELGNGLILLNAVCFLPYGRRGTRQRVFFAVASKIMGPYYSLGPLLQPINPWELGENGHAAGIVVGDKLELFYQARTPKTHWRYGIASMSMSDLEALSMIFFHTVSGISPTISR